jgi:uncharacterized protein
MDERERVVIDTNTLISAILLPSSIPDAAVTHAMRFGQLLMSEDTLGELAEVLARPKFDRYVTVARREEYLRVLLPVVEIVEILQRVKICRDPRDDKFLEVAANDRAQVLISGDDDLLVLDPFLSTAIVTPAAYLQRA